jgi:hypothetical protein
MRHFFTNTYLFCLHKYPHDKKKLLPIGIPTAIHQIIATHVAKQWKDKFALHLLPYNFAVGVPNGMDFIIKSMQLSIKKSSSHDNRETIYHHALPFLLI